MKNAMYIILGVSLLIVAPSFAAAQTASGTLSVSATVNGSISLVFNSDAAGVALAGAGTNAATMAFGAVQAFGGVVPAGATRTTAANSFTISSPFDVNVTKANSTSANYKLTAQLNAADAVNTWQIGASTITNAAATQVAATAAYGANNPFTLALTVPFATASGTSINNAVNFVATAN